MVCHGIVLTSTWHLLAIHTDGGFEMTIPLFLIVSIVGSAVVWAVISLAVALLMFGDDRAFVVGPVVSAVLVGLFWMFWFGLLRIA